MCGDGSLTAATVDDVQASDRRACDTGDAGRPLPLTRRAMEQLIPDLPQVRVGAGEGGWGMDETHGFAVGPRPHIHPSSPSLGPLAPHARNTQCVLLST